jgi:hypothetical protein
MTTLRGLRTKADAGVTPKDLCLPAVRLTPVPHAAMMGAGARVVAAVAEPSVAAYGCASARLWKAIRESRRGQERE